MTSQLSEHIITCIHYFNTMAAGPPAPHKAPSHEGTHIAAYRHQTNDGSIADYKKYHVEVPFDLCGCTQRGRGLSKGSDVVGDDT